MSVLRQATGIDEPIDPFILAELILQILVYVHRDIGPAPGRACAPFRILLHVVDELQAEASIQEGLRNRDVGGLPLLMLTFVIPIDEVIRSRRSMDR